ncbi:hypothetical protein OSTOST_01681, partial [Ostertagia ostertagi]
STGLSSKKGLLTLYCNKIDSLLEQCKAYGQRQEDPELIMSASETKELVLKLNATSQIVSEALSDFTSFIDSLADSLAPEQLDQANAYIDWAQECIDNAHVAAIELEAKRISAIKMYGGPIRNSNNLHIRAPQTQKFNYLISALRGDAKKSVRRFNVTEANYEKAVDFLRKKNGDESRLIDSLQMRLERACAENLSLEEQRRLLDTVMPLVAQLGDKGVFLNGSFLSQKVLSIFKMDLQRKFLSGVLMIPLKSTLGTEERINYVVNKNPIHNRVNATRIANAPSQKADMVGAPCLFCIFPSHKSLTCTKYATIEERSKVFRSTNRCLNCGTLSREGCRNCNGKKHHHTLCPLRVQRYHSTSRQQLPPFKKTNPSTESRIPSDQQRKWSRNVEEQRIKKRSRANAPTLEVDSFESPAMSEPPHVVCNRKTLEQRDKNGAKHEMLLHTLPVLTTANKRARLTPADLNFIESRHILLSKAHHESISKPQILIGRGYGNYWMYRTHTIPCHQDFI